MTPLMRLKPGRRFSIPSLGIAGKLLDVGPSRATVRIDGRPRTVEIPRPDGSVTRFRASGDVETSWSKGTLVEVER